MENITVYYSIIDKARPVFGRCQFSTIEQAREALAIAITKNSNLELIKETCWD